MVTFESGAVATVVTSLLSPRELSRIRIDTSRGTLEVDHVYGYSDADWSWTPAPDATTAANLGSDPGLPRTDGAGPAGLADAEDVWAASAGLDLPSNHAAQIDHLVDDMLAGRRHDTTLASTRPTMEFITALYKSSIEHETVHRSDLTPADRFTTASTVDCLLRRSPLVCVQAGHESDDSPTFGDPLNSHERHDNDLATITIAHASTPRRTPPARLHRRRGVRTGPEPKERK